MRWLLDHADASAPLTQTGNMARTLVFQGCERFDWFRGRSRSEFDIVELWTLRELARQMGAVRRSGRKLLLTSIGKALHSGDTAALWHATAANLGGAEPGADAASDVALLLLHTGDPYDFNALDAAVAAVLVEQGWRDQSTGAPISDRQTGHLLGDLRRRLELLGLTTEGWFRTPLRLTDTGRLAARSALRTRHFAHAPPCCERSEEPAMAARRNPSRKASILTSLSFGEKGELLDQLLAVQPQLRAQVEQLAHDRLAAEDRHSVAVRVEDPLTGHGIEKLSSRAGRRPGRGYVHESEAAAEILDEALQPFLDDMHRRATLGMTAAAMDLAIGVLCGLYEIGDSGSDTLVEYAPDYAIDRAEYVVHECAKVGIVLPVDDLLDVTPEWSMLLRRATQRTPSRR